jgi:DNA-binding MarR family transcriptional regulator
VTRTLKEEIKQTRPFRHVGEEAYLSLVRTAAMLEHRVSQALKPHGLTATQYNVLRILRGAGAEGLCRNEVGERLVTAVPDVTRLLDRMEQMGLISRERGTVDRRYVTTRLSKKGAELVNKLDAHVAAMHEQQLGHLDKRSLKTLVDLLALVRERG